MTLVVEVLAQGVGRGGDCGAPPPRLITPGETKVSFPEARVPVELVSSFIPDEGWIDGAEEE